MLGTLQKANDLLAIFTEAKPEWGVTEVATLFNDPKSTTHELLSSLTQIGWLSKTDRNRYRLGTQHLVYNRILLKVLPINEIAKPALQQLANRFGTVGHLGILDHGDLVYVDATSAAQGYVAPVGARFAAHATAMGKVLLATILWRDVKDAYPAKTVALDKLKTELESVKAQGYAASAGDFGSDASVVAAPVFGSEKVAVAAIGVSIPAAKLNKNRDDAVNTVKAAAAELTKQLAS